MCKLYNFKDNCVVVLRNMYYLNVQLFKKIKCKILFFFQ